MKKTVKKPRAGYKALCDGTIECYKGDCIEVMDSVLLESSIDMIFADPPYNLSGKGMKSKGSKTGGDWYMVNSDWDRIPPEDYLAFTEKWISSSKRVLTPKGTIFVCATYHNIGEVTMALKKFGFRINNIITWYKSNVMPNMTRRTYTHACEFIVWAALAPGWVFNYELMKEMNPDRKKDGSLKQMRDLWTFPLCQGKERLHQKGNRRALHPTQKPQALVERAILASTHLGDMVLDPFHGSGTTGAVSALHGRRCIGIERDSKYYLASVERIKLIENLS